MCDKRFGIKAQIIGGRIRTPMAEPPHPVLAIGRVRHVGDPVAIVIAESLAEAKDAAERIVVDYDELSAVASSTDALADGAPQLHDAAIGAFVLGLGQQHCAKQVVAARIFLGCLLAALVGMAMHGKKQRGAREGTGDETARTHEAIVAAATLKPP